MSADPRGPIRTILSVDWHSDVALVRLDCGHVAECNPIFSYAIGEPLHCFKCGAEAERRTGKKMNDTVANPIPSQPHDRRDENVKGVDGSKHCSAFVGVHSSSRFPGNTIYVIINERCAFDLIDLPMTDHGKVLTKVIDHKPAFNDAAPQYVIFQYWLEKTQEAA